jgi:hypothetical protein
MKKSKYVLITGAILLISAVALSLPASATTSVWLHEGEPLSEHAELALTGGEVIEVGGSAMVCQTSATMTTEGGSTAQVVAYEIDKASCFGVAGELEGCEVTAATPVGLPWDVGVNSVDLTAEDVAVDYSLDEACPIDKIEIDFPELTLTPEEPGAIQLFRFSQEGKAKVDGKEATLSYTGSLQLPEEEFGTYGIG